MQTFCATSLHLNKLSSTNVSARMPRNRSTSLMMRQISRSRRTGLSTRVQITDGRKRSGVGVHVRCSAADETKTEAPAETWEAGRDSYQPDTFEAIVQDAVDCVNKGLADGIKRMEVEYPLSSDTSGYKDSSDAFIDAHIQFAIRAARLLSNDGEKKVRIVLPDAAEMSRAMKKYEPAMSMAGKSVSMGCLTAAKKGPFSMFSKTPDAPSPEEQAQADLFICINASTVELPNVREYCNTVVGDKPVILWCMELDTLRADLGLVGFPGKELQYTFLSTFRPMFYIRQRGYSKTVNVAPFVVNYSGALFRTYPSGWQVMLKQDNGQLACVAERKKRYTLNELKEELLDVVGLATEEPGSPAEFLRKGFKAATWWEENEVDEVSDNWRY